MQRTDSRAPTSLFTPNDKAAGGAPAAKPDWLSVVALAVTVHVIASVTHEAVGHGGTCLLTGCTPQLLTSMRFDGDESTLSTLSVRAVAAAGAIANLVLGSAALRFCRRPERENAGPLWFFLWLLTTVNLLQATGYLLYSGVLNIGDWSEVVRGLEPAWFWHGVLALTGGFTYWLTTRWAMRQLAQHLHATADARVGEAYRYTLVAYLAMGGLELIAGLREPGGAMIVLISGVAASFGGTSALAWGPQLLHDPAFGANRAAPLTLPRNWPSIVVGLVLGAAFALVLGPGIALR